ncbi:MAG: hypothetical protein QM765_44745 [Myxococcales bacterium]
MRSETSERLVQELPETSDGGRTAGGRVSTSTVASKVGEVEQSTERNWTKSVRGPSPGGSDQARDSWAGTKSTSPRAGSAKAGSSEKRMPL